MHTYVIKGKLFPECYNKHKLTYGQGGTRTNLQNTNTRQHKAKNTILIVQGYQPHNK